MKQVKFVSGLLLSLLLVVSCSKIEDIDTINIAQDGGDLLVIEASAESYDSQTKTIRQEDGSVYWNPNDAISLFFMKGEDGGYKFTSQNKETAVIAEFSGTISGMTGGGENLADEAFFWAVYPYSSINSCDGNSVSTSLSQKQQALQDTFADDLFITIARSTGVKMAFKNVCGGIKFRVSQSGIKSIVFRGNNEEVLAGDFRATFDESNQPTISEIINGKTQITVIAPNGGTFDVGKYYYLVSLPAVLKNGFTITFHKADGTSGTYTRTSKVEIKRSIFGVVRDLDQGLTFSTDNTIVDNSESGFYIGITGFNNQLYTYPIQPLTSDSLDSFKSFIDGLVIDTYTLLLYSVDQSINFLQTPNYPSNLSDVSIVTFTDGLDEGSLSVSDQYLTSDDYLESIHTRLTSETVSGLPISAYSVGLLTDEESYPTSLFRSNMEGLATSPDNAFVVSDMSSVNDRFSEIADNLSETKYVQDIKVRTTARDNGTPCRITFDIAKSNINTSNATISKKYIDGIFNRQDGTLYNLSYVGITADSGSAVTPEIAGVGLIKEYIYTFYGVQSLDGELIPSSNVVFWYKSNNSWISSTKESSSEEDDGVRKLKRSAAVILNIDCSNSLGANFPILQKYAKSFIDKLLTNSIDPGEVASIKLNKSAITLTSGSTTTLTATVLPTTALKKDVEWSSTNSAVASVDQTGKITAISPGSTTIIAKTVDGGLTATCSVSVVMLANKVQLDYSELELYNGDTHTLQATVFPENASDKTVSWSSSNTAVATVDSNGIITPVKAGQTTITAIAKDGSGVKATCLVTVLQHVESISLSEESVVLDLGETKQIEATVYPSDATNKNFVWSSSDNTIVSVDDTGIITALKKGTAQISATTEDGSKQAICQVEVQHYYVSDITLNTNSVNLYVDETASMVATIYPTNASNKNIVWSSSNTDIASVNQNGLITGISSGATTIYATAQDGSGIVAECNIDVSSLPQTPINLALSVLKNDIRYFVPLSNYQNMKLSKYTKEGITIVSDLGSFVLSLTDYQDTLLGFKIFDRNTAYNAITLPSKEYAQVLVDNWTSINDAIISYNGTSMDNKSYWTQSTATSYIGGGGFNPTQGPSTTPHFGSGSGIRVSYYYYDSSGVLSTTDNTLSKYARKVIATL